LCSWFPSWFLSCFLCWDKTDSSRSTPEAILICYKINDFMKMKCLNYFLSTFSISFYLITAWDRRKDVSFHLQITKTRNSTGLEEWQLVISYYRKFSGTTVCHHRSGLHHFHQSGLPFLGVAGKVGATELWPL
jgi:hypothetical protein